MHFEETQGIKYYKECTVPWLLLEAKQYRSIFFWSGGWMGGEYREGTENASALTTPVKGEKFKWTM